MIQYQSFYSTNKCNENSILVRGDYAWHDNAERAQQKQRSSQDMAFYSNCDLPDVEENDAGWVALAGSAQSMGSVFKIDGPGRLVICSSIVDTHTHTHTHTQSINTQPHNYTHTSTHKHTLKNTPPLPAFLTSPATISTKGLFTRGPNVLTTQSEGGGWKEGDKATGVVSMKQNGLSGVFFYTYADSYRKISRDFFVCDDEGEVQLWRGYCVISSPLFLKLWFNACNGTQRQRFDSTQQPIPAFRFICHAKTTVHMSTFYLMIRSN